MHISPWRALYLGLGAASTGVVASIAVAAVGGGIVLGSFDVALVAAVIAALFGAISFALFARITS